jgi:FG-GAP-like repeat
MRGFVSPRHPGSLLATPFIVLLAALTGASAQQPIFVDILQPALSLPNGLQLSTGDIHGDGLGDALLVSRFDAKVWEGTADGLSSTATVISAPGELRTGRLADLDDDGLADLVLLPKTEPFALVGWSQGDGSFSVLQAVPLPTHGSAVAVGDVTDDGKADLLVNHIGAERLAVVPGLGNRQFGPSFDTPGGPGSIQLKLGDIDADGALDLLSLAGVFVLDIFTSLGLEGGQFAPPTLQFQGTTKTQAVFIDANLDGFDDVVCGDGEASVSLLAGQSDGSLAAPALLADVPGVNGLAAGDVTGDAQPDVLVSADGGASGTRVTVLRQTGAGLVLDASTTAYIYEDLWGLAAADVDGDGLADAVSSQNDTETIGALISQQGGGFRNGFVAETAQRDALVLDADGDGHPDLLSAVSGTPSGRLRRGQPNGVFGALASLDLGASPQRIFGGDADLDGDLDVLAVQNTPATGAVWLLNDGDGGFTAQTTKTVAGAYRGAAADDLDGDGRLDVVISTQTPSTLVPLLTLPSGTLAAQTPIASTAPNKLAAGDFDGAGWHDVALVSAGVVEVLLLQPAGEPISTILLAGAPGQDVVIGNFDGDGLADILVPTESASHQSGICWIENDGSGTPAVVGTFPLSASFTTGPVGLGDADGDGFGELLLGRMAGQFSMMCAVFHSQGGPPTMDEIHPLTSDPARFQLADADGDGALDLVVLGAGDGPVLVLPNSGRTWQRLGHSLAGGAGLSRLEGTGPLVAGTPVGLRVEGALPSAAGILVVGLSVLEAPFKGGVMVPDADWLLTGPLTDAEGALTIAGNIPAGVPSGTTIAAQVWFADGSGPAGYSATWGVAATSP